MLPRLKPNWVSRLHHLIMLWPGIVCVWLGLIINSLRWAVYSACRRAASYNHVISKNNVTGTVTLAQMVVIMIAVAVRPI